MEQYSNSFYIFLVFTILFMLLVNNFSFKNGSPTCDNYVINNYLYLALSISILGLSVNGVNWNSLVQSPLLIFIISLVLVVLLTLQRTFQESMNEVYFSHLYWFLFIISISIVMYIFLRSLPTYKYINSTIMIVAVIFVVMSSFVYLNPSFFEKTYNFMTLALLIALISIIVIELSVMFFASKETILSTYRYTSYVVILIFSLFISYDTTRMFEYAKKCINYPNYPKTSTSFFLDIVNLFMRILSLRSR